MTQRTRVHGLVLAAGAGRRMGRPKALVAQGSGSTWVETSVDSLLAAGCDVVTAVVGAEAEQVAPLVVGRGAEAIVADDWQRGMGASLVAGLRHVAEGEADTVVIMLVDLPGVSCAAVRRLVQRAESDGAHGVLARAAYGGRAGHPVVVGRDHWGDLIASVSGDRGARDWLAERPVETVECGDIATGDDVDDSAALARWRETESRGGRP